MKQRTQTGFTLYELLTVLLIVGIVLTLGVPNMLSFRQNSTMTATANDLHSAFHLARSEASRAKTNIAVCATADSTIPLPVCGGELEAGWVVFEDRDGDVVIDAGEPIIKRFGAINTDIDITTPGPDDFFLYASTGVGRLPAAGSPFAGTPPLATAILCDDRGNDTGGGGKSTARVLVVTPLGRATVLAQEGQVAFHGGC